MCTQASREKKLIKHKNKIQILRFYFIFSFVFRNFFEQIEFIVIQKQKYVKDSR